MKLWNKRKYAWLTMAVMTALFSGTTAMAQTTYDQQINEDLENNRTYWDNNGVRTDATYAFKDDTQLSVKSSAVNTAGQGYFTIRRQPLFLPMAAIRRSIWGSTI